MKQIRISVIALSLLCMIAGWMSAQEYDQSGFCPITKGMYLEYVNYDADGHKTGSYVIYVKDVSGNLTDGKVTFDQYFYDEDGEPVFSGDNNVPMTVIVCGSDGTVSQMKDVGRVMKIQDVMSKGDASSLPSDLSVGMSVPDGKIKVHVGSISASISTTGRVVVDQKDISVQAGTFSCYLVKEDQETKAVWTKVDKVETWYAKGIGCVRQKVYDKKGRLDHTQELVSLKFD